VSTLSLLLSLLHTLLDAGIKEGCEVASFMCSLQPVSIIVKLDFSNVFNCLRCDFMLDAVLQQAPEIYNYCRLAYTLTILPCGTTITRHGLRRAPSRGTHWDPYYFVSRFSRFRTPFSLLSLLRLWMISLWMAQRTLSIRT